MHQRTIPFNLSLKFLLKGFPSRFWPSIQRLSTTSLWICAIIPIEVFDFGFLDTQHFIGVLFFSFFSNFQKFVHEITFFLFQLLALGLSFLDHFCFALSSFVSPNLIFLDSSNADVFDVLRGLVLTHDVFNLVLLI